MEDSTEALATTSNAPAPQAPPSGDGATQAVAAPDQIGAIESVIAKGDLSKLSSDERVSYYRGVCESVGLNPFTEPFEYIRLSGKLTLYPTKGGADQLRDLNGISITKIEKDFERQTGLYTVTVHARDESGRTDVDEGVVYVDRLSGDALANARMKAMTKGKRRVTLSMCGLGMTDSSEMHSIPSAEPVEVDHETGEMQQPARAEVKDRRPNGTAKRLDEMERRLRAASTEEFEEAAEVYQEWVVEKEWTKQHREELDRRIEAVREEREDLPAKADPAEADPSDAHSAGTPTPEGFRGALEEAAAQYETAKAKTAAINKVASEWDPRLGGLADDERARYDEAFSEALMEAQEDGEAGESATDDMLEGKSALDAAREEDAEGTEAAGLPESFPWRGDLFEAGLHTDRAVLEASESGELEQVEGIGQKRAQEITSAAERLRDTGDHRTEAVQQQAEDIPY